MFTFVVIFGTILSIMSRITNCEIKSNRIRKIQNGGYTDIFQKEAEAEAKRRRNVMLQGFRGGGRRW